MDEQELDKYFHEHLDNYRDDGSSGAAWHKMNHVLELRNQKYPEGVFLSKRILTGIAALILLLIASFIYGLWSHNQQVKVLYTSIEEMREELDGRGRTASRVDTLIVLAGADGKLHSISPEKLASLSSSDSSYTSDVPTKTSPNYPTYPPTNNLSNTSTFNNKNTSPAKQENKDLAAETSIPTQDSSIAFQSEPVIPSRKKDSTQLVTSEKSENLIADTDSLKEETEAISQNKPGPLLAEKKKDSFLKKLSKQLGFRSGFEGYIASGGSEFTESSTIPGVALGVELKIGERFAIRSGARLSSFSYELENLDEVLLSEDFSTRFPGTGIVDPAAELHEIKMSGTYFEIPIGIRYYYPLDRRFKAFAGLDISGGSFLNENFKYEFIQDNNEFERSSKATDIPWNWGAGRFSLGAAFALKPKWNLETALFFEKDLASSSRGVEDFNYYLFGLSTSIWLSQ